MFIITFAKGVRAVRRKGYVYEGNVMLKSRVDGLE